MSYRDNAETDYRIIRSHFETASLPQQRRPLRWVGARAKNVFSRHAARLGLQDPLDASYHSRISSLLPSSRGGRRNEA